MTSVDGSGTGWTGPVTGPGPAATATPVAPVEPADEIAALVRAVPGVADLHAGRFGEVATYLPGRRVTGVTLGEDRVEVHVVLEFDAPLRSVAERIHIVLAAVVTVPVLVFVEDLATSAP